MQMIIVDDEAHWVDNLSMFKPWHTLGIEQVHRAYSAQEALQIIETNPIDIVISDIIMPEMTGLELIERVRTVDRRIKCIILSGHSDFEFTKKALQNQAIDYLLKPPTDEELFGAVRIAIDQLNREWEQISSIERTVHTIRENLPLLQGQLLLDAFRGQPMADEEWERKLENYLLPFHEGEAVLLLVRIEEASDFTKKMGLQLLEYAMMNMTQEILGESCEVWGVKEEHGYLAFVLQFKGNTVVSGRGSKLEKLAMQLQNKVKQFLRASISIVMTEGFQFPQQLPERYLQATSYFRQIVGDEREFVTRAGDVDQSLSQRPLDALYMPPSFMNLLEAGRWEAAREKIGAVCAELDRNWAESLEHCMEAGFVIGSSFTYLAHRNGQSLTRLIGADMESMQNGEAFSTISKLRNWSLRVLAKLQEANSDHASDSRSTYVSKLQAFAEKNLHLDVSLRALADHVNLHPTHLSKIYKMETGEGISDYVSRLRMERACHKLKTTDKKIYEISQEIGYLDPAYFIKVFKRQFGVTPQEYRDGHETHDRVL
ncbi:response regulator transcription factor [Paenibacillus guangzhouensis]|uniref:response regulator transcription factor n=1 Tax=Paenibacillus guangzhouensis TaxID=1473112 RepID=UPI0012674C1A|nr:response regulator [Paenibacillus guangzhouensis]